MITNSREYQITKLEAGHFSEALARVDQETRELHPRFRQSMREALESQRDELLVQMAIYEADGSA
ncbi:MAG: hypothetical protein ACR2PL_25935 [Dehalococcoidia bacterium]